MLLVPYFSADAAKEPTTQIKDQIIFYFILNLFLFFIYYFISFCKRNEFISSCMSLLSPQTAVRVTKRQREKQPLPIN